MHCCLGVCVAANVRGARSASRALIVLVLMNDKSIAKSAETTVNDRLLHFMVQPLQLKKATNLERRRILSSRFCAFNSDLRFDLGHLQVERPCPNRVNLEQIGPFDRTADIAGGPFRASRDSCTGAGNQR